MKVLNEKYILKQSAKALVPGAVIGRHKQPYRSPDGASFITNKVQLDYVEDLLSGAQIQRSGVFKARAVESLVGKFRKGQAIGIKDNMALVGILSTQLIVQQDARV